MDLAVLLNIYLVYLWPNIGCLFVFSWGNWFATLYGPSQFVANCL